MLGLMVNLSGCIAAGPDGRANAVVAVLCVSHILSSGDKADSDLSLLAGLRF